MLLKANESACRCVPTFCPDSVRLIFQALKYDPKGEYVRAWLPLLHDASAEVSLWPFDIIDGWPQPVVEPETQLTWQDAASRAEIAEADCAPPRYTRA